MGLSCGTSPSGGTRSVGARSERCSRVLLEVLLTSRVHKAEGGGVRGPCWLAGLPCGLLGRVSGMGHGKRVVGLGLGWVKGLGFLWVFPFLFLFTLSFQI